jgi:hypothetical protein
MIDVNALVNGPLGVGRGEVVICEKCGCEVFDGLCNCSLTKPEETQEAPVATEPEQQKVFSAKEALKLIPGAPVQAQIDAWKSQFGAVYSLPFSDREIFLWRPLNRFEWQQFVKNEALVKDEQKFQEQIVTRAVLYPKLDAMGINQTRAGTIQTLYQIIMQGSYFISAELAINMVEEM